MGSFWLMVEWLYFGYVIMVGPSVDDHFRPDIRLDVDGSVEITDLWPGRDRHITPRREHIYENVLFLSNSGFRSQPE